MSDTERRIAAFLREEADRATLPAVIYERVLRGTKIRRMVMPAVMGLGVIAIVMAGLVTAGALRSPSSIRPAAPGESPEATATLREVDDCPLTIPPEPAFVPPEPYPAEPPDLYQRVWYGTTALWTMIDPEGEVWKNLPDEDGSFTEKTFWWSDAYPPSEEPSPPITVTGRRLDGPGSLEAGGPAGGGLREDIGSFMLVGIEIPAGCWELTATYRGAELSYVVLIKD